MTRNFDMTAEDLDARDCYGRKLYPVYIERRAWPWMRKLWAEEKQLIASASK